MIDQIKNKLASSAVARWSVLGLVSLAMLSGYVIADVMAPLEILCEQQLGWSGNDYGFYTSAYGWLNVFLLMLIFGGMLLDKIGPRATGLLAMGLMIIGGALQYWAMAADLDGLVSTIDLVFWKFTIGTRLWYASVGFAIFGVGIELIGITANKIVVQWFTGRSLALALGLNVAAGRIGTALAFFGAKPLADALGSVSAPMGFSLLLLCVGLLAFLVYIMIDMRVRGMVKEEVSEEDKFKFSDIGKVMKIRGFWYIAILCLLFYAAVFPFLKYAVNLMVQKFQLPTEWASIIPGLMPLGNILMTPLFGSIYDRRGKGATIMIIGSVMLLCVHLLFAMPGLDQLWQAVTLIIVLGAAFSLVPSAMWPSVTKIVPYRMLGTAYSLIFWIQNWGLMGVPLLIAAIRDRHITGTIMVDGAPATAYNYTWPMLTFALFGAASVVMAVLLKREDRIKGYGLELPNNR